MGDVNKERSIEKLLEFAKFLAREKCEFRVETIRVGEKGGELIGWVEVYKGRKIEGRNIALEFQVVYDEEEQEYEIIEARVLIGGKEVDTLVGLEYDGFKTWGRTVEEIYKAIEDLEEALVERYV